LTRSLEAQERAFVYILTYRDIFVPTDYNIRVGMLVASYVVIEIYRCRRYTYEIFNKKNVWFVPL